MLKLLVYIDTGRANQHMIDYIAPLTRDGDVDVTLLTAMRDRTAAADLFGRMAGKLFAPTVRHVHANNAPDAALLQEAQRGSYDLAVFGPMRERWSRWLRGAAPSSLSAQLPISSLLVRGASTHITNVLVCAGGDATVIEDARLTVRLARRAHASATVLHVVSQLPVVFGAPASSDDPTEALAATGTPEIGNMQAAVDVLRDGGVDATLNVRVGLVVDEIAAEVQRGKYDLLVIGAHRSQGLVERLLFEDVSKNLLGQSPVPVLVVKTAHASVR
jgi:nucleotide-binding universal stress UspA family protein